MNIKMLLIGLGAVAIFIWFKLSPKAEAQKVDGEEASESVFDKLKEGATKIAGIVGTGVGIAKVVTTILPKATVLPKAVLGMLPKAGAKTVAPAVLKTGLGATVGGALLAVSPAIIVPVLAKILDAIFPKHVVTESEQKAMDEWTALKKTMISAGAESSKGLMTP